MTPTDIEFVTLYHRLPQKDQERLRKQMEELEKAGVLSALQLEQLKRRLMAITTSH